MKKIAIFLIGISLVTAAFCQKMDRKQIPLTVKNNVYLKINDTLNIVWEKCNEIYKAKFTKEELKAEILMKQNGEWVCTVWEIPVNYVPQSIMNNIHSNYPGYKITNSTIEYLPDGDYYVMHIKKKKDTKKLFYNLKGDFVKDASVIVKDPTNNTKN